MYMSRAKRVSSLRGTHTQTREYNETDTCASRQLPEACLSRSDADDCKARNVDITKVFTHCVETTIQQANFCMTREVCYKYSNDPYRIIGCPPLS